MANLNPTQRLLVATAWVDGHLDEREARFLRRALANGSVSVQEIEGCLARPGESLEEVLKEFGEQAAPEEVLREVMRMCFADEILEAEEFALIERVSNHLGLDEATLEQLRQELVQGE